MTQTPRHKESRRKATPNRATAGEVNGTSLTVVRNATVRGPDVEAFERKCFDRRPEHPWLLRSVNSFGQEEWFIRVEVTGLHPRRLGPMATQEEALKFYAHVISELAGQLDADLPQGLPDRIRFGVFIEDEIARGYLLQKGR